MQVASDLRLVLPLRADEKGNAGAWAYHTPISLQVFEANYRILAATKAALFAQGPRYAFEVGAQVAALHLRDAGRKDAADRIDLDEAGNPRDGGATALLAEMHRLTQIAAPSQEGWEPMPMEVAQKRGIIDDEDVREVEHAIVFFTAAWWLTPRAQRLAHAGLVASVARGSTVSLSLSDWIASLPKWTPAGDTPKAI